MKVNFNTAALQEALALVTSIVPSRTPKPILRCIKLVAQGDSVKMCATDLEVGITYIITQVEVAKPGTIVIPADKFASIVRESIDDSISLEASESSCQIRGKDSFFTIYAHDVSQFPATADFEGEAAVELSLPNMHTAIEQTLFATARESTRYAINGVLWEVQGKKLNLVATDGRRLSRCKVDLISAGEPGLGDRRIIVPAKTMSLLARLSGSDKDQVSVKLVDNQIVFKCCSAVISSNLVEGNFPKYDDIIPHDYTSKLSLNTDSVLSAVRRAALLTNEDSKGIKLAISKNAMTFTSRAPETGDAQIDMSVDYSGVPTEIGFNPAFLLDVLKVIKTSEFDFEFGQSDRPGLIKSGLNYLYVVMPINLG